MPSLPQPLAAGLSAGADLAQLLSRIRQRDQSALQSLYEATSAKLYGIALRMLKDRSRAEDVVQEIYIKIWEQTARYDAARGPAMGWLAVMTRNAALDQLRARLRLVSSSDMPHFDQIASTDEQPFDYCLRQQDRAHLRTCLDQLEETKKAMVTLAYQEGYSREELAERFAMPVATVKTWLRRSLETLRGCLAAYE